MITLNNTPRRKSSRKPAWRDSVFHRLSALEAGREAQRVLGVFERDRPGDRRPRLAIQAIRAWAQGRRQLNLAEVRGLSLGAHAAALVTRSIAAGYAARAAGHAVATWHVPTHALAAFSYADRARRTLRSSGCGHRRP